MNLNKYISFYASNFEKKVGRGGGGERGAGVSI